MSIAYAMGFVDVGTWQLSGAKLDFFRGTWQKVKQKHCYIQGKLLLEGLFVRNSDKEGTSQEGAPTLRRFHSSLSLHYLQNYFLVKLHGKTKLHGNTSPEWV